MVFFGVVKTDCFSQVNYDGYIAIYHNEEGYQEHENNILRNKSNSQTVKTSCNAAFLSQTDFPFALFCIFERVMILLKLLVIVDRTVFHAGIRYLSDAVPTLVENRMLSLQESCNIMHFPWLLWKKPSFNCTTCSEDLL